MNPTRREAVSLFPQLERASHFEHHASGRIKRLRMMSFGCGEVRALLEYSLLQLILKWTV
jgi:hypothetical protein